MACGDRTKEWKNSLCDSSTLATHFPSFYHLSLSPSSFISDFYFVVGDQVVWDALLRRNLSNAKVDDFTNLLHMLSSYRICIFEEDYLIWWLDPSGTFSSILMLGTIRPILLLWSTLPSGLLKLHPMILASFGLQV